MNSSGKTSEENGGQEAGEDFFISDNSTTAEYGAGAGDFVARPTHMKNKNFVPARTSVDAEATSAARLSEDAAAIDTFALHDDFAARGDSLAAGNNITVATEASLIPNIAARDQVLLAAPPNVTTDITTTIATAAQRNFIIPQTPEAVRNLTVTTVSLSPEASLTQKINIDFIAANAKKAVRHKKSSAARTSIATTKGDTAGEPPVVAEGNEAPPVTRATAAGKEPMAGTSTTTGAPVAVQPSVTAAGNVLSPVRVGPSVPIVVQASAAATDRSFLMNEATMNSSSSIAAAALVIADLLSTAANSATFGYSVKTEVSVSTGGTVVALGSVVSRSVAAHEPPAEAPEATAAAPQAFRAPEAPTTANSSAAGPSAADEDSAIADDSINAENTNDAGPPMYDPQRDPLVNFLNGTIMVRYGDCLFVGKLKGFSKTHIIITKAAFYVNTTHLGNLTNHRLERRFIWKITCARPPYKVTYPRIDPK